MTIIDLGDVGAGVEPVEAPRPPWRRRRLLGRLKAAAAAALCVVTLGSSATAAEPTVRLLWEVPYSDDDQMTYDADVLVTHRNGADGHPVLTGHDLATGAVRWSARISAGISSPIMAAPAGMLLISNDLRFIEHRNEAGVVVSAQYVGETVAVDLRTGAERWRGPGGALDSTADTVLLAEHDPTTGAVVALRMVGARDGATSWRRPAPPGTTTALLNHDGAADRVITYTAAGQVTVLRTDDGTPVVTARLPWQAFRPERNEHTSVEVADNVLLAHQLGANGGTLAAYRLDTLRELWRTPTLDQAFMQQWCGERLCLRDDEGIEARDPATGAVAWRIPEANTVERTTGDLALVSFGGSDHAVVDTRTGRQIGSRVRGEPLWTPGEADAFLLRRPEVARNDRGGLVRVDPATGRATMIGRLDGVDHGCLATGRRLICFGARRLTILNVG